MTGDTEALIADKLLELAKKRGLDKVTVNQIVEECGISRQGFYYYYQDILDVARQAFTERLKTILDRCADAETPDQALQTFAEELEWQLPAIALGLNSKFRAELEAILLAVLKEFIRRVLIENSQDWGVGMERRQLDFRVDFLACGIAAYATEHCGDKPFDTALFTEQMNAMLEPLRH